MFLPILLVILAVGVIFVPKEISDFKTGKVKIVTWILLALLLCTTFVTVVNPGTVVRAYQLTGGQRTLTVGFNILPP